MKNNIVFLFVFMYLIAGTSVSFSQLYSKEIEHVMYEDAEYKTFLQSSGAYEFVVRIEWDYESQILNIVNTEDESVWFNAKWNDEINPDELPNGQMGRFLFDAKLNVLEAKALNIYMNEETGLMRYEFETPKTLVKLLDVWEDYEMESIDVEVTEGDYNGPEGDLIFYLNLSNATDYTIYFSSYVQNESGEWVQSPGWTSIEPGNSAHIGVTHLDFFYYYAYCRDSKNEFIIWEGTDYYTPIDASDGSYGFRRVSVFESGVLGEDGQEYYLELTSQ